MQYIEADTCDATLMYELLMVVDDSMQHGIPWFCPIAQLTPIGMVWDTLLRMQKHRQIICTSQQAYISESEYVLVLGHLDVMFVVHRHEGYMRTHKYYDANGHMVLLSERMSTAASPVAAEPWLYCVRDTYFILDGHEYRVDYLKNAIFLECVSDYLSWRDRHNLPFLDKK